ncbi:MAG: uroporphyrinogen-III C-methyltransferase [Actinobacteria bacterium]|nr:uroporphyrinogen-III C-methyltransferase [Actinomycetota bacterium]
MVYLVGSGPGDPDLITRAGLKALWRADVVAYDRLVAPELLEEARPHAELVYVGKDPHGPATDQDHINRLLVERARAGLTVVRLKGGDPFVFGRGGEEAMALTAAAVPFQVVPGVSAAVAVPAYAGIPVTHRRLAASFAVVTGRTGDGRDIDWRGFSGIDTLVLLMGVGALDRVATELVAAGRDRRQPAAIIENGTLPSQRVIVGALEDIAGLAVANSVGAPATVVVGEVVRLRSAVDWFTGVARELAPSLA